MATDTWTDPRTWVSGETPTTAQFNAHIRDNVGNVGSPGMVLARRTSAQSISDSSDTNIALNASDLYDTDSIHSTSTNNDRLVVPSGMGGMWQAWAQVEFASDSSGARRLQILDDSATEWGDIRVSPRSDGVTVIVVESPPIPLAAADYITLTVTQTSGGNLNVNEALFGMWQVGRTVL